MSCIFTFMIAGAVFLHGYGVRGGIWQPLASRLAGGIGPTFTPDLNAGTVTELISLAKGRVKRFSLERHGPVLVVGHSLGAVLGALAAQDLGPDHVAALVMMAPPYGERETTPGPLLRFLLRHRLLPPGLVRPRFFSHQTPVQDQKRIFADAVPEARAIQDESLKRTWFHVSLITGPLELPSMVIASEADRIVPFRESAAMAEVLGSRLIRLGMTRRIAHDDLFAAPAVVDEIADTVLDFTVSLG